MPGIRRFAAKLAQFIFVLWAVVTILFLIFRLMPGNPLAAYIDPTFTQEQQAELLRQFGLDRPLYEQYFIYLGNVLQGELGDSFFYRAPVWQLVWDVFPNTVLLTVTALVVAYIAGILGGSLLAWKRGTRIEAAAIPMVLTTRGMPDFWLGMIMLAVFAFSLGWFPSGGSLSAGATFDNWFDRYTSADFLSHLALPVITLAIYLHGLPLLLMRSNMLDVLEDDFVTMARIKGLSEWTVIVRHAARNALLPLATAFAFTVGSTIASSVVIETVFSWPGLGRLLVKAVSAGDYPLAQGAFLLIAIIIITMNLVADMLYSLLDPRVAHA
mgnify:CR=1 FL=1